VVFISFPWRADAAAAADFCCCCCAARWCAGGTQSLAFRPKTAWFLASKYLLPSAPPPASLRLLPSAVVPLRLQLRCCCRLLLFRCGRKKNPFDGEKKNFFRRGYIDLRMHEEGYRAY
jgi:hypothetical protein